MIGFTTETITHKNLVDIAEKASRMPCGLDTESDGPSLVAPSLQAKSGNYKYQKFLNMYRSTTVGFSVAFPDKTSYYVPVNHHRGNVPYRWALGQLESILKNCPQVFIHNLKHELLAFDRLGVSPQPWGRGNLHCTQVLSWLACYGDEKGNYGLKGISALRLGHEMSSFETVVKGGYFGVMDPTKGEAPKYACEDAVAALLVGERVEPIVKSWKLWDWYNDTERPCIHMLRDVEDYGLSLNTERSLELYEESATWCRERALQFERLTDASLSSPVQMQVLFDKGWWPRLGKPGKSGAWSTNEESLKLMEVDCKTTTEGKQALKLLFEYREYAKVYSTYSRSLVRIANQYPDGRLHPSYHQTGTTTGRFSSSSPNAQNMPARGPHAKACLEQFAAPEGQVWGSADYSQIDLRVLAHFAGGGMQKAFQAGEDPHQATADKMGVTRNLGKTLNFAVVYGAQGNTLAKQLGVDKKTAAKHQKAYMAAQPEIPRLFKRIQAAAYDRGYVKTIAGRRRLFPDMPKRDRHIINKGFPATRTGEIEYDELMMAYSDERKAGNTVCQGGAADVVKKAMVDIYKERPPSFHLQAQIHDDIRWATDGGEGRGKEHADYVQHKMESAWDLKVPLIAEPVLGRSWKELKE